MFPSNQQFSQRYIPEPVDDLKGILNDSLPHSRYRELEDSLRLARLNLFNAGSGFGIGDLGYYESGDGSGKKFITIGGYRLKIGVSFIEMDGKPMFKYDQLYGRDDSPSKPGTYPWKPSRFEATNILFEQHIRDDEGKVYLQGSSSTILIMKIIMISSFVVLAIACLYAFLYIPIRFLNRLSRGKIFDDENIGTLHFLGWCFLAIYIFFVLLKLIPHLIILKYLPEGLYFNYHTAFLKYWYLAAGGLALLILRDAFRKGAEIKEEQELTV